MDMSATLFLGLMGLWFTVRLVSALVKKRWVEAGYFALALSFPAACAALGLSLAALSAACDGAGTACDQGINPWVLAGVGGLIVVPLALFLGGIALLVRQARLRGS
jgi:hypothetical protein